MTKEFIVRINYTHYAVPKGDAVALLDIASRMRVVKQNGYSGPYFVQPDQEPFVETLSLHEVVTPEPESEPETPVQDAPGAAPDDDIAF
jgi:hypothetical protein